MRILFVTWNYPPKVGGMETLMSQLVNSLQSHADVHVLGPYAPEADPADGRGRITRPSRDGLLWFAFNALVQGMRQICSESYDVVVAGGGLVTLIAFSLGRLAGLPVVVNVHGLDLIYPQAIYQWMIRFFLPKCDHVFAISQATADEAARHGVPTDNISVVHPGLDFAEFETVPDRARIRQEYNLNGHATLLSAGRLAKRKGLVEFVKFSLPTIVEQRPDTLFLIVGDNPDLSLTHKEDVGSQLQAAVKDIGLENHVRMLGWVEREDLIDLYHACDVFVLPGIHVPGDMEGFGIVLLEASAAGKPVVSTRLGGITDAVADEKSGILVETGMWDELSDAILGLLDDESRRQALGRFGRERARREFDWPIIARRYAGQINSLLAIRQRPSTSEIDLDEGHSTSDR